MIMNVFIKITVSHRYEKIDNENKSEIHKDDD